MTMGNFQNGRSEPPTRKEFNAFVDDGALISGVKRSTRDGFKKMIKDGAIRLFVPLHTLDRLRRIAASNDRMARDARDALTWLDDVTSTTDRVCLQGGMELYDSWQEVEQYLLPETLLSMKKDSYGEDSYMNDFADLRVDSSDRASMSSRGSVDKFSKTPSSPLSAYSAGSPIIGNGNGNGTVLSAPKVLAPIGTGRPSHAKSPSVASVASADSRTNGNGTTKEKQIPFSLRPFFNHVLWRIHHEQNTDVPVESFLLVTNDELKQTVAQRFGIRAKRVEQLRDIVGREDRDYKARLALFEKDKIPAVNGAKQDLTLKEEEIIKSTESSDDEDEVVLKRSQPIVAQAVASPKVLDPDVFSRRSELRLSPQPTPTSRPVSRQSNGSAFGQGNFGRGSPRSRGGRGASRGNRASSGVFSPPAFMHQASPKQTPVRQMQNNSAQTIDPDSFSRPSTAGRGARGGKRRLWEPS